MNDRLLPCDHVIFLIHPCLYEQQDAETVRRGNWQLYVERERQVKRRWLAALAARPPDTLYVQLGGPTYLLDIARSHLGAPYVCFPAAEHTGDLHRLYVVLADCVRHHVGIHKLRFDPRTVTSEVWGESFEGCVPGYGGAFAQYLGLKRAPRLRFEMTVYDSRFLHGAQPPETIALPGSDVQAWLFACHDTTAAAMFLSPRTAQWIDRAAHPPGAKYAVAPSLHEVRAHRLARQALAEGRPGADLPLQHDAVGLQLVLDPLDRHGLRRLPGRHRRGHRRGHARRGHDTG